MPTPGLFDFDGCGDGDRGLNLWAGGSFASTSTSFGVFGGFGIQVLSGGFIHRPHTAKNHLITGHHRNVRITNNGVSGPEWYFREGTTIHVKLFFNDGGAIQIIHGNGTLLGTIPAGTWPFQAWAYVEAEVLVHDTTGVVNVYLFGLSTPYFTFTGDTRNGGTGVIDNQRFMGGAGNTHWIDDMYMVDGSVGGATVLGANQITCRVPVSDSLLQWTPSAGGVGWSLVDERPFSGTDFISETTNNERSLFGISDDGVEFNVRGVRVIGQMSKTGLTTVKSRLIIEDGIDQGNGADRILGSTATVYADVFPGRPGGADWDAASVDALTIGVEKVP